MHRYEYKVVPAPSKGTKAKGVKTPEGRFALTVEQLLNQMGADGWEFQRAELLPSDERSGLTGSVQNWRNVLVFRRVLASGDTDVEGADATTEDDMVATPVPGPVSEPAPVTAPAPISAEVSDPPMASGAERMLKDNGVEELSDVSGMTEALKARAERQADEEAEPDETVKRD
ncbi:DUF4177 domain-containing protein [Tropicibacter sp. R16_0]|uniref:DUF4177 domain-containing protein n=1 Tax=Tropicibacter sp. R16_0 TaxID=2821102 RepID=UPI001ADA4866|nr:DUF4177 domain-containing protein [Tropicibacter sp. R16_0]MBO9450187.1 DUF4177 domain-containing protein [Tropicibacter sp. R16_0]